MHLQSHKTENEKLDRILYESNVGFRSLENAVEALNKGAHNYLVKPLDIEKVVIMVKKQLKIQEQEKKYSQEKVTEYIETRIRQLEEEKPAIHKRKQ